MSRGKTLRSSTGVTPAFWARVTTMVAARAEGVFNAIICLDVHNVDIERLQSNLCIFFEAYLGTV